MIRFGKMYVEGFASIVDETFDWGLEGLNIIQAPNGYGKTKFINALVWCLYGKTLSGSVEPWAHVRPSSYVGTMVRLHVNVDDLDYIIIRYNNYHKVKNLLEVQEDGDKLDGDKRELQKQLETIIGYSYDLFKNSIIFGQKLKRLISETGPNKKKVLDEAFEVLYIPKAKKIAEEKLQEFMGELSIAQSALELADERCFHKRLSIESEQQFVDIFEKQKKKEIREIKKKIQELLRKKRGLEGGNPGPAETLNNLLSENESLKKDAFTRKEYVAKEKELTKLQSEWENLNTKENGVFVKMNEIHNQIEDMPTKCPECGKPYTAIEQKYALKALKNFWDKRKAEHSLYLEQLSIVKGQISELEGVISSALNCMESIEYNNKKIEILEGVLGDINGIEKDIQQYKKDIEKIRERPLENNIEQLKIELKDLEELQKGKRIHVKRVARDVKIFDWMVKHPLSNSGLKAFIFNQMLDDINDRLEFYTKFIGFQVGFVMDMQSANKNLDTFIFYKNEPVPYEDLSGGQQQRVDIATAFAIHDVVSQSKECSLLIMDEIFESLDKDNIEIMTDLIQDKAKDKCLYLVTHRAEFNPTNANIIQVDYTDGITSLA